jgi:hypothetical protein
MQESQRSFDLPNSGASHGSDTGASEQRGSDSLPTEPRGNDSRQSDSKPAESRAAEAPTFHSNQSFHFEPTRTTSPSPEANKTYTVWSSGPTGSSGGRDE